MCHASDRENRWQSNQEIVPALRPVIDLLKGSNGVPSMTPAANVAGLAEAYAPCTSAQRQQVNNYLNHRVTVGGRAAVINVYIPITGSPADRIKVTFPENPAPFQAAPANIQTVIDGLVFVANP
jgi:hypothetical protein